MTGRCPRCGLAVLPAFPGAETPCPCGETVAVGPRPDPPAAHDAAPYRAPAPRDVEPVLVACPFCGHAPLDPLARVCPTCDVRLDRARCRRCFALGAPGEYACARCGASLPRDVLFDATDAPCPRCAAPLATPREAREPVHECPHCFGVFVTRDVLARLLDEASQGRIPVARDGRPSSSAIPVAAHYVPCPMCHARMNRTTLARGSGVVVDVCARHGAWFEAGELTRTLVALAARPDG